MIIFHINMKEGNVITVCYKKFKETINRYIPTLFLGAPISHMLILYSDKINEIISMNPILFALFLIPIILIIVRFNN